MKCLRVMLVVVGALTVTTLALAAEKVDPAKKLYDTKCGSCHGKDGKGNPAMSKAFKVDPAVLNLTTDEIQNKTDEDLLKLIAEGKGKMPAYGKQLKADQQKQVLGYVRKLAPKKEEEKK